MEKTLPLKFANNHRDFAATVNKRVNEYFKLKNTSRYANAEMIVKTIIMFSLYFVPYSLILAEVVTGTAGLLSLVAVMGFGLAGIGLSVMHDANHGAYSKKSRVNDLIGYSLNLIGANAFNWKVQHNVMHHSFTNVHEEDEDISPRGALRLTPHTRWKKVHRYQFIYAWFLYGLLTIVWLAYKDFYRLVVYHKNGMMKKQNTDAFREWCILLLSKSIYVGYIFILPAVLTSLLWWQVMLGIIIMHYMAGFILAIIFQPAHVIEGTEFPLPDETRTLQNNWAAHQLYTTTNFGNNSRWFSWYVGGLNFQIEHHLFPNICHVHYRRISGIVRDTALEFGLPYKTSRTFWGALCSHGRLLRKFGERPALATA